MNPTFETNEKIRFAHCDFAGIVFFPRFLEMLNGLVEDWFDEKLKLSFDQLHEQGAAIPTVQLNTQFKSPARLGDILIKQLWVKQVGKSSLTYTFKFLNHTTTVLEGEATLVYIQKQNDGKTMKPAPWPLVFLEALKNN